MARIARAAGLISLAILLSRVLGLVREQVFALLVGASHSADAFQVGFRVPNLLRDLFAEGALSQAFIPVFKQEQRERGDAAAHAFADRVVGTLAVVVGAIVLAGVLAAPAIVEQLAGDFHRVPGKLELAVDCTRIMLPFLPIVSFAAIAMGMLNARERFGPPSLASAAFNVATIAVAAGLWIAGFERRTVAIGWSIGTLVGGLAQLGVQLPALRSTGYRARPRVDLALRDPALRRTAKLLVPSLIGLAATQVNLFVNTSFASSEPGAVSWLNYAFRFLQLPIGLFGVAIGIVSATRFADAAADRDEPRMAAQMNESLRLLAFLCVPATVGLFVLSEPIVRLIYERGAFAHGDTVSTAAALRAYTVGLCAYAAVKVLAPAFYARGSARAPVIASILAVAVNLMFGVIFHERWGFEALALGTSFGAIANFAVLMTVFYAGAPRGSLARLVAPIVKIVIAAAATGGAAWGANRLLHDRVPEVVATFGAIVAGGAVYAAVCLALRLEEAEKLWAKLTRRGVT